MSTPAPTTADPVNAAAVVRPPVARLGDTWQRLRFWVIGALGVGLAGIIIYALARAVRSVDYANVMSAVHATPDMHILMAVLFTGFSYLALTEYDASSLRYAEAKVARGTVLLTSFVAYALSNTIGLGPLSGGAVRLRLYTAAGLDPATIARVVVFNAASFALGMCFFGALGLLWGAAEVAPLLRVPSVVLQVLAGAMLAGLFAFLWVCSNRRVLSFEFTFGRRWRWSLKLPPFGLAVRQLVISAVELCASAAVLWFLLPPNQLSLPTFIAFYAIAIAAGIVSHVPGGVGVFEAVMLLSSRSEVPSDAMLGALLLNRGIYYVLPLVLATFTLVIFELRSGFAAPLGRLAVRQSPRLMAALCIVAGLWLMVSGVTPFTSDAREVLAAMNVPLPLIEASNFLASVAGLGLLLVARGLLHELDAAWWAALALSIVAAALCLPKGIALTEAAMLVGLAVLLVISRRQFDRRSSLFSQRLEAGWLMALAGIVIACGWVLTFAYREVAYNNHMWWEFELDATAPRSLRTLLGLALVAMAFCLWQLFRPRSGRLAPATAEEIERAAAILRANPEADAGYVLTGDKHLLFSPSGKSFVMYGKQGRTWVALHGPVGLPREWPDLVWQFIELAHDHGGRAAFYQVTPASLPLYLDCGLKALKLGEHAHVDLTQFSLKGAKRQNLRTAVNRAEREGLSFDFVPAAGVAALLPELRAVSDAWLAAQHGREKGFSVGRFDPAYLQRLPVAVVRREGRVIAFINLLATDVREEAEVDLMRYFPDSPPGTMDFLFAKLMLHLQTEGYERFGLGMSPMAGMAERRKAPRWQRIGRILYDYGDRFYNFRGLRSFKDKFDPVWEARYLATPGGLAPVFVLADVAALIGGSRGREKQGEPPLMQVGQGALLSIALALMMSFGFTQPAKAAPSKATPPKAAAPVVAAAASAPPTFAHGRFTDVQLIAPVGTPQQFVLMPSFNAQPDATERALIQRMTASRAMVAFIPLEPFLRNVEKTDGTRCHAVGGDFDNLARHLQGFAKLPTTFTPLLVGQGRAASYVYGVAAQAPAGTFAGVMSLGFCPQLDLRVPMCAVNALRWAAAGASASDGVTLQPAPAMTTPWAAFQAGAPAACAPAATEAMVHGVPRGSWHTGPAGADGLPASFDATWRVLAVPQVPLGPPPAQLADLPLVENPVKEGGSDKRFAILLSGDGGWAAIDKGIAAGLVAKGVPVAGFDSLRYFWSARTPEGLAADLDRVIRYYASRWKRSDVVLIGFSQGADVLPFALNRLPAATRDRVRLTALLGPGQKASFEFHVTNWIGPSGDRPIEPEAKKLSAANTVCLYGTTDKTSLCPALAPSYARPVAFTGDHHMGGDYGALAARILEAAGN